ncbi:hypothetical protein AB0L66_40600 [Streptomyces sp. NPDC052207]|uniref:hypothetical protein n=1 Tax=Streptomyces sp. NPDC052207 TaxID=3155418 RepID=UPI003434CC95
MAAGIVVALIAGEVFHALPGPFIGIAGIAALMAAASGSITMILLRLCGSAGVSLATIVLLIFGNATSGGILPADYLPAWLYPLHAILPVGVGVHAIQGLSYFHNDGLATGIAILLAWILASTVVLYLRDVWSTTRIRPADGSPHHHAASGHTPAPYLITSHEGATASDWVMSGRSPGDHRL